MDLAIFASEIIQDLKGIDSSSHMDYIKAKLAQVSNKDQVQVAWTLIQLGMQLGLNIATGEQLHIVVLIHGIRTHAAWQEKIAVELNKLPNVKAIPIGYGYLDAFRFLCPVTRKGPIERVLRELREIKSDHKQCDISVIAHSFGTHIVSKILQENSDIAIKWLLLCGSIVPASFKWNMLPKGPNKILNEVGTKDIWPVIATKATWGYGSSGTFGFKTYKVQDRFHDLGHSDFFDLSFIRKYWMPYFSNGDVIESEWTSSRHKPSFIISVLSWVPFKLGIFLALALSVFYHFK